LFDDAMRKLVKRSYFHTMSGTPFPTIDRILYEWDKIWHDGRDLTSIMGEQHTPGKNRDSLNVEATKMIRMFHAKNSRMSNRIDGILGEDYRIPLDHGAVLVGTIDLVLTNGRETWLPHYTTKNASSFKEGTEGLIGIVLDAIAYRAMTGRIENYSTIEYLKTGKTQLVAVDDTMITEAKEIISDMMTRDKWPAATGTYYCDMCTYRVKPGCRKW
jgi:CRISPR/Cas system-associated exonuclease Cas4 (RecB family)